MLRKAQRRASSVRRAQAHACSREQAYSLRSRWDALWTGGSFEIILAASLRVSGRRAQLLVALSSVLLAASSLPLSFVSAQSSTGVASSSSSAVLLPAFDTFTSSYEIDWSVVYAANPPDALSIPENTDLGTCICDLTFNKCDINCKCDSVWSVQKSAIG